MRRFYEMRPKINVLGDDKSWDEDQDEEWSGCCEDPYDDEEENEKEWCD